MGMILLDVEFRAERAFKIQIPRQWPQELGIRQAGDDATLADMLAFLLRLCREQNVAPPEDAWSVLIKVVCAASGAEIADLTPETYLVRDIAPFG
jgi:hypothetical protein